MKSKIFSLITGFVTAFFFILILLEKKSNKVAKVSVPMPTGYKPAEKPEENLTPATVETPAGPPAEDDLVLIEGIGPKVAAVLKQHGICTFAQLAETGVPALRRILQEKGWRFMKPDSWPEQGCLAAAGKVEELKALQEKLVAGR